MSLISIVAHAATSLAVTTDYAEERPLIERLWYAQGLAHPMIVHMPIALLLAAAIAAAWRLVSRRGSNAMIYFCLFLATGGAVLAATAGWAWAPQKDPSYVNPFDRDSAIFWHRWGGIGVAALSVLVLSWATVRLRKRAHAEKLIAARAAQSNSAAADLAAIHLPSQVGWQLAVVALAGLCGWVGHQGGELVYPQNLDHILAIAGGTEPVKLKGEKKGNPPADDVGRTALTSPTPANRLTTKPVLPTTSRSDIAGAPIDFAKQIAPILQEKCVYCHGPNKPKAKLRLDTEMYALAGGANDGPLYKAGDPVESNLIKRVIETDPDDVMPPPKEKKQITPEQLALLKQWIVEGAKWNLDAIPSK